MLGYLIWQEEGRPAVTLERRTIGGAVFLVLDARGRERRLRRRIDRAVEEMARRGVRRWVVPENWPEAWRRSVAPVPVYPLRRALLSQMLDCLCARQSLDLRNETALLSAPRADEPVRRAAELLSRRCRYLVLQMEGAEGLYQDLWRRFGLSPGMGQGGKPRLQVSFGEPLEGIPALLLGPDCQQRQTVIYGLTACPEAPFPGEQTAAALWSAGALSPEEIRVRAVEFHA